MIKLRGGYLKIAQLVVVVLVGGLLPAADLAAQMSSGRAKRVQSVDFVTAGAGLDAGRVDRHLVQLGQPPASRPSPALRKTVIQSAGVAVAKGAKAELSTRALPAS